MGQRTISRARFVSFEGIDGCGKSTLISQLSKWLDEAGIRYILTREPGGTLLGERIRGLLLDPAHKTMGPHAEVLLYTASRAQLVHEVIHPALREGLWVLTDRYIDATLAYQGYGRGLELDGLRRIQDWATQSLRPHNTVLLDCDAETAFARLKGRNTKADRMEQEDRAFHQRVRDGYLELARSEPKRFTVLNADKPLQEVITDLRLALWKPLIEAGGPAGFSRSVELDRA